MQTKVHYCVCVLFCVCVCFGHQIKFHLLVIDSEYVSRMTHSDFNKK